MLTDNLSAWCFGSSFCFHRKTFKRTSEPKPLKWWTSSVLSNRSRWGLRQRSRTSLRDTGQLSGDVMRVAGSRGFQFGLMLVTALSCSALWPATSNAYTFEEEQACSGDAFRLCSSEIPDVDRITACMVQKRDQLSSGCRVFFRGPQADARRDDDPVGIRPTAAHRHVRPHRVKRLVKRDAT